ncbi:MAG TPA: hypothetical protein VKB81_15860 [Nitrospira sp.]|nr:hypothetical protein [Nitrospira sp.]
MLCSLAIGLTLLRTVDAVQADVLGVVVVQDWNGITVEDGDDGAAEVSCERGTGEKDGAALRPDDWYSL